MRRELVFPSLVKWPFCNHNIITPLQTNCPAEVTEANKMKCQELDAMIIFASLTFGRVNCEPAQ